MGASHLGDIHLAHKARHSPCLTCGLMALSGGMGGRGWKEKREGETRRSCDQSLPPSIHQCRISCRSRSHICQYHGAHRGIPMAWSGIPLEMSGHISDIRALGPRPMQYDINPSGTAIGIAVSKCMF